MFGLFGCWIPGFAIQELLFLLFLLVLCRTLRIERLHLAFLPWCQLGEVPYEQDQFPTVIVFLFRTPCWHTGQSNPVVDGIVKLSIGQFLCSRQAHIWGFRV